MSGSTVPPARQPAPAASRWASVVDTALEATIVGSFTNAGIALRRRTSDWSSFPSMNGANVLITGGTSGIGRATAEALYELGADVILTSRSLDRARDVASAIESASDHDGSVTGAAVDTADFRSINELVDRVRSDAGSLDVLINNAGALTSDYQTNDEGMELTLASHLVGPYHLMMSLRPLMTNGSRVLWMSSGGMYTQKLDVDDLEMDEGSFRGAVAYAKAKRGQVEMVAELGPRWAPDIVMHAMHPGWVDTDGVDQGLPGFSTIMGPFLRSAEQGADTMVWLATGGADDHEPGSFFLDRAPRGIAYLPGTGATDEERAALINWLDLVTLPAESSSASSR